MTEICPYCGAWSVESCEIDDDFDTPCVWYAVQSCERDPDRAREDRDELRRLEKESVE